MEACDGWSIIYKANPLDKLQYSTTITILNYTTSRKVKIKYFLVKYNNLHKINYLKICYIFELLYIDIKKVLNTAYLDSVIKQKSSVWLEGDICIGDDTRQAFSFPLFTIPYNMRRNIS